MCKCTPLLFSNILTLNRLIWSYFLDNKNFYGIAAFDGLLMTIPFIADLNSILKSCTLIAGLILSVFLIIKAWRDIKEKIKDEKPSK